VEPQRADTIPYFYHLKEMAMNEGVMGFSISGSGPTLFSLSQNKFIAENVKEKVCAFLKSKKIRTKAWVSTINQEGVIKC
jgi:homoserine kinase